jgi:hypothetical protein
LNIDGGILNELEEREKNNNTHWVNKKNMLVVLHQIPKSLIIGESLHIGLTSKLQNYNTKKCKG